MKLYHTKLRKRSKPDANLAKVVYELSSKGRNTMRTTKLPGGFRNCVRDIYKQPFLKIYNTLCQSDLPSLSTIP